jgi:hypothetical protein
MIHSDIAFRIVSAVLADKNISGLYKIWQENATMIAKIYHKYHCPVEFRIINEMMQEHLATTLPEVLAIISPNCAELFEKGRN